MPITAQPSAENPAVVWVCSKMNWLGFCWHKMWPNVTATETERSWWWWWWVVRTVILPKRPAWCEPTFIILTNKTKHTISLLNVDLICCLPHSMDTNKTSRMQQTLKSNGETLTHKSGSSHGKTGQRHRHRERLDTYKRWGGGLTLQSVLPTFWPDPHL